MTSRPVLSTKEWKPFTSIASEMDPEREPDYHQAAFCVLIRPMVLKSKYALLFAGAFATAAAFLAPSFCPPARLGSSTRAFAAGTASRTLYAVNQSIANRGSISVYDIEHEHGLVKTIQTVPNVDDVKGVVASAATGKLYVAYRTPNVGMIYCLDVYSDAVLWNKVIDPDVDRLSMSPDGRLLYVPTWEGGSADYINVLDALTGEVLRRVYFSNRSHDTLVPLSGPIFQETKATDGSGKYLYLIDPTSYAVSRIGPYAGILGPFAVNGTSRHVVNNVTGLWGMQVADIKTGRIVSAPISDHPRGDSGLMHGIGWTPDEREVWQSSSHSDPHIYVWQMADPMAPKLKQRLPLRSRTGSHWVTFDVTGRFAYVAPAKNSDDGTEIFDTETHMSVGLIGSSEDMIEIDFAGGRVSGVGNQFGIGRVRRAGP
jgi:hypothetical protein